MIQIPPIPQFSGQWVVFGKDIPPGGLFYPQPPSAPPAPPSAPPSLLSDRTAIIAGAAAGGAVVLIAGAGIYSKFFKGPRHPKDLATSTGEVQHS